MVGLGLLFVHVCGVVQKSRLRVGRLLRNSVSGPKSIPDPSQEKKGG